MVSALFRWMAAAPDEPRASLRAASVIVMNLHFILLSVRAIEKFLAEE